MSSTTKYILLGIVIAALLVLFVYSENNKKKGFNWRETYDETSKQPFGSFVMHDILKTYFPNKTVQDLKERLSKSLPNPDSLTQSANYVFVGDGFYADTADTDKLLLFVSEGNRAFVTANVLPNYFLETIFRDSCDDDEMAYHNFAGEFIDSANLYFKHPSLAEAKPINYDFTIAGVKHKHEWSHIDTLRGECTEGAKNFTPLGYLNDNDVNFVRIKYGKGEIYLHSNPIVFTNFHLLDTAKLRYASKVFSHLTAGTIYWDTKSRTSRDVVRRMNGGSNMHLEKDGPLKYILAQYQLRWAWFIMLSLIGLYLLFAAKRKQRIIPVLEEKSNTSLDFIQTIGQMYFRQGEHIRLCDMMMKQFQTFVREKYHLASREMNEDFINTITLKSDIPFEHIKKIVGYEFLIERNSITEQTMVEFHHLLNYFYKNCK